MFDEVGIVASISNHAHVSYVRCTFFRHFSARYCLDRLKLGVPEIYEPNGVGK